MNDNRNDDQFRFNKLYQLLGDEVNQIYDDQPDNVFFDENSEVTDSNEELSISNEVENSVSEINEVPNIQEINNDENDNSPVFDDVDETIENINNDEELSIPDEVENSVSELNEVPDTQEINNDENDNSPVFDDVEDIFVNTEDDNSQVNDIFNIFNSAANDSEYYKELNTPSEDVSPIIDSSVVVDNHIDENESSIDYDVVSDDDFIHEEDSSEQLTDDNSEEETIDKNEFRNKTLIDGREFNDGLDGIDDRKKSFVDVLTGKNMVVILAIIALIVVAILTIKAFHFGKVVDMYNEYTTETEKEEKTTTNIYGGDEIDSETLKKVAASELIDCIKSPIETSELPESVTSIVNDINTFYNKNSSYFAFAYKDIFTGFTVTYNENGNVFAASTIKAPVNIYLYEMASEGKVDLERELLYTGSYYNTGTGVLKNKQQNTKYSMRTLSQYAIRNSDNAAHNMLTDELGRNNIKNFWQQKGTSVILTGSDNWGLLNAHDAMIYMKELYTFYVNNEEYGNELMDNFLNASAKFLSSKNEYAMAHKSGWSGTAQHDAAIVFAENPYIVIALSHLGYDSSYMSYFNRVSELTNNLHQEYWKYKMDKCSNIKQYQ